MKLYPATGRDMLLLNLVFVPNGSILLRSFHCLRILLSYLAAGLYIEIAIPAPPPISARDLNYGGPDWHLNLLSRSALALPTPISTCTHFSVPTKRYQALAVPTRSLHTSNLGRGSFHWLDCAVLAGTDCTHQN